MINWLVAGIGDITIKRVIPAILAEPQSHLYGVVTRDESKGRRFAEHVWMDFADAVNDPAIDAVYIGTPVFLHSPQTIVALRAGKHVLCEKPTALNYAQASEMVRVAREANKIFGVAYYRRLFPKVQRAKELLEQRAIGQPVFVEANNHMQLPEASRGWLLDPTKAGGGPLFDIASHRIDVCNYLFGRAARVSSQLSNAVHRIAVEDNATLLIEYKNGVRAMIDVRWHSSVPRDQFRIIGTDGELNLDPLSGPELVYPGGREHLPCHPNVHYPCIENFVAAVLDGAALVSSGVSAIQTDWITEQACVS